MKTNQSSPGEREQLVLELGVQIHALISAAHALSARAAARFDSSLQPAAFHLVRWLYSYGPTNAAALAEATAMDRSSVSRLIKQLEVLGYACREASLEDGRGVVISLTDAGRQQTIHALQEKESVFQERIAGWDDGQLQVFTGLLRRFNGFGEG